MSYVVTTDRNAKVIYQRVAGIYTTAELMEANAFMKSVAGADEFRFLLDLRDMRHMDIPETVLENFAARMRTELPVRYRALVVHDRHVEELRQFAASASSSFGNVKTFESIGDACTWLMIENAYAFIDAEERRYG